MWTVTKQYRQQRLVCYFSADIQAQRQSCSLLLPENYRIFKNTKRCKKETYVSQRRIGCLMRHLLFAFSRTVSKIITITHPWQRRHKVKFDVFKCRECQFDASEESAVAAGSQKYSLMLRVYKQSAGRSPVSVVPKAISRASDMHPIQSSSYSGSVARRRLSSPRRSARPIHPANHSAS